MPYIIALTTFFINCSAAHRYLPSSPTRRSADLLLRNVTATVTSSARASRSSVHDSVMPRVLVEPLARTRGITESWTRSEEHTAELQSQSNLVCRLLLEKKKIHTGCIDLCCVGDA